MEQIEIRPQPGPQTQFLSTDVDIAIYGGAAGGGKTFALLLEPLRHLENPLFRGVIFRRTSPQIRNVGGLWDESAKLFSPLGINGRETNLDWISRSGWHLKFSHLEQDSDRFNWQGSQMCFLGFDELTHFSEEQFFYLLSRLRSMSGIKGYVRATCNPDPDSWLARFIDWWIDPQTGYAVPERSGHIRWFIRLNDEILWSDSREDLLDRHPNTFPKSVTFITANITDNKILLDKDPNYMANLHSLPFVEREKLLKGNWHVRASAGNVFKRSWFEILDSSPNSGIVFRFWDRAGTVAESGKDPDWTVGCRVRRDSSGFFWIEDVVRFRGSPATVEAKIRKTAEIDGPDVWIGLSQDPGQAGIADVSYLSRQLSGYKVKVVRETGSKIIRAQPVAAQAESGNVKILRGKWNHDFLSELEGFPDRNHDDQVDALSGAFNLLKDFVEIRPRIRML